MYQILDYFVIYYGQILTKMYKVGVKMIEEFHSLLVRKL